MNYPIDLSGRQAGKLNISRDGLYTLFQARISGASGLYRLWLQGEGRSAALGLMSPGPGGLVLCRRMSRLEMRSMPGKIERVLALLPDAKPEAGRAKRPAENPTSVSEPEKPGIVWHRQPDGSLRARDGAQELVALPASLRRAPPGVRLKEIEGRLYLIFRY